MKSSLKSATASLSTRVRERRKALGLTQEDLAALAGIDRTYASQIERKVANPSLGIICALADVLECEVADFFR